MSYDFIKTLKSDNEIIERFSEKNGTRYGIGILDRGENLFFQLNEKAIICEIDAVHGVIYKRSIKRWDTGGIIKKNEIGLVLDKILEYYKKAYNPNAKIV